MAKKATMLLVVGVLLLALSAGVALARTFTCNPDPGSNECVGTPRDDRITGTIQAEEINALAGDDEVRAEAGNDVVFGRKGNDTLDGGLGSDTIRGNEGNDTIDTRDGMQDFIDCGENRRDRDVIFIDQFDRFNETNCEIVFAGGVR